MGRLLAAVLSSFVLLSVACARVKTPAPDLHLLYGQPAALVQGTDRRPVILIPGMLGSKLVDEPSGRVVWGAFSGNYANPFWPDGAQLVGLPMEAGTPLGALRDSVVSTGALDRLKLQMFMVPIEIDAYVSLLKTLCLGGYRDEDLVAARVQDGSDQPLSCFQFDYDWRRDNVENAARLHEFILEKRRYLQQEYATRYGVPNYDVKFDLVAHSMGGLLARYYLQYGGADLPPDGSMPRVTWAGARFVERAILVAPPNAGAVKAFLCMVEGRDFGRFATKYEAALIGTFPSIYQLLPRTRHRFLIDQKHPEKPVGDIFDPELWERMKWGLANPKQMKVLRTLLPDMEDEERRRIALDHLRKCLQRAEQFSAALDVPATPPNGLALHLLTGDAMPTDAVVAVNPKNGKIKVVATAPGDGAVLRTSALMDERINGEWRPSLLSPIHWDQVTFLSTMHLEITRDPIFSDNILYVLLEQLR